MYSDLIELVANESRNWLLESSLSEILDRMEMVQPYPEMLEELRTIEGLLNAK